MIEAFKFQSGFGSLIFYFVFANLKNCFKVFATFNGQLNFNFFHARRL
jgi:hypothetical protein